MTDFLIVVALAALWGGVAVYFVNYERKLAKEG